MARLQANKVGSSALLKELVGVEGITAEGLYSPKSPAKDTDLRLKLSCIAGNTLESARRDAIFALFKENMFKMYESSTSMPWNESEKRRELFHPESRFITIDRVVAPGGLAGYTMFRFDEESNADGDMLDVVYCYELQVSSDYKGQGLGRLLMQALEVLAKRYSFSKVMLTVFKANIEARSFYSKIGFENDEICPSRYRDETTCDDLASEEAEDEADYEILSKLLSSPSKRTKKKTGKKKKKEKKPGPAETGGADNALASTNTESSAT